jgi:hypothetical protein
MASKHITENELKELAFFIKTNKIKQTAISLQNRLHSAKIKCDFEIRFEREDKSEFQSVLQMILKKQSKRYSLARLMKSLSQRNKSKKHL